MAMIRGTYRDVYESLEVLSSRGEILLKTEMQQNQLTLSVIRMLVEIASYGGQGGRGRGVGGQPPPPIYTCKHKTA